MGKGRKSFFKAEPRRNLERRQGAKKDARTGSGTTTTFRGGVTDRRWKGIQKRPGEWKTHRLEGHSKGNTLADAVRGYFRGRARRKREEEDETTRKKQSAR